MAGDHTIVVESQSALFSASPPPPQCLAAWVGTARQYVAGFIQGWGGGHVVIEEESRRDLGAQQRCY